MLIFVRHPFFSKALRAREYPYLIARRSKRVRLSPTEYITNFRSLEAYKKLHLDIDSKRIIRETTEAETKLYNKVVLTDKIERYC